MGSDYCQYCGLPTAETHFTETTSIERGDVWALLADLWQWYDELGEDYLDNVNTFARLEGILERSGCSRTTERRHLGALVDKVTEP